jgi:hypothetical protein
VQRLELRKLCRAEEFFSYRILYAKAGLADCACLGAWLQGQEPSGAIWALCMWAPGQIGGMRVGGF